LRSGVGVGAGLGAMALVGCGDGSGTSETPGGQGGQPQRGGSLLLPGSAINEPFDPATVAARAAPLWNLIGDPPLRLNDKTYEVGPSMIESWEFPSPDQLVLKVRPGMTWHDIAPVSGRAVTAEDIATAINYHAGLLSLPGTENKTFHRAGNFTGMETATASDESTVVIKMSSPSSALLYGLADFRVRMFPKEQLDIGFENSNQLIASGPFMMKPGFGNPLEYGSPFTVSRNPKYMNSDLPYFDSVEVKYIVDPAAQDSALLSGGIDILSLVNRPAAQIQALLAQGSGLRLIDWTYGYWHWLLFNMKRAPWTDKRVREAIFLALDYKALGNGFYGDMWTYSGSLPPSYVQEAIPSDEIKGMAGWNPDTKKDDREKAKQLLSDAGFADGEGLNAKALIFSRGPHFANATRVKEQLEEVFPRMSVELDVKEDSAAFFSQTNEGNFDFNFYGIFPTADPTLHLIGSYGTEGGRNYGKYSNAQVDQLLSRALEELDDEARTETLHEVQEILNEDLPYIPLYTANLAAILRGGIEGFEGDDRPGPGGSSYSIEDYARYMYKTG
jgi:peptide/nickel transport system substrate-binding protein